MTVKTKKKPQLFFPYCPHALGFCTKKSPCTITLYAFNMNEDCRHFKLFHPITHAPPSLAITDDIIK